MRAMIDRRARAFVALLALMLAAVMARPVAGMQTLAGQSDGIVVTGSGVASGPATAAEVQVMIGPDPYSGMMPGGLITAEEIEPIVAEIVAAGVAEADIEVTIPASNSSMMGPFPGGAMLSFEVPEPTQEGLSELAQGLHAAALAARLSIQHLGVRYVSDDCEALLQEASDAAVADARTRAERMARSLGVELGELVQAAGPAFVDPAAQGACGPTIRNMNYGPWGPGMEQPFDPTLPAEAAVSTQVTLTFAMGPATEATPVAG
jgi:uncharacterized protein YggE